MKCPKCNKEMILLRQDKSINPDVKPEKEYLRKVFWCKKDDIWVKIESPIQKK